MNAVGVETQRFRSVCGRAFTRTAVLVEFPVGVNVVYARCICGVQAGRNRRIISPGPEKYSLFMVDDVWACGVQAWQH